MNDQELEQFGEKLRAAVPSFRHAELGRNLWPDLLKKVGEPRLRISWFDWTLAALAAGALIFFPGVVPVLLYHF